MSQISGLWWWEDLTAVPASRRRIITAIVVLAGFLLSIFLIGGMAHSKIGLVDENDLPQYIGTSGQVAFSQIPHLLLEKTEIGQFGQSQRFRPIYYLTRITETALFGLEGSYWYSWRIAMFGAVIAAMFWLYTQCAGLLLGAVLTAYTLSFAMWIDIWTRSTGANEQYSSLGSAIFAIGGWQFIKRWREGEGLGASCGAMVLGAVIAMGSKENMLILELPLLAALSAGLWHRRLGYLSVMALSAAIIFGIWIASSIVVYFLGAKVEDIYGNSVRGSLLAAKWIVFIYVGVVITVVSVFSIDRSLSKTGDTEKVGRYRFLAKKNGFYAAIIVGVFVFNFVFYTGHIPSGGRYDFPAILVLPALLMLLLHSLSETAELFGLRVAVGKAAGIVLIVVLVTYTALAPWGLPGAVTVAVERNSAFDAGLREARRITVEHPQWPIFIKSFNPLDLELVQSLGVFFIARGINNPRYLVYVENPYGEPRNAFQTSLDKSLSAESVDGMVSRGYFPLVQGDAIANGNCFVIVLRKPEQFAIDQANGKDPLIGKDCARIPLLIYWDNSRVYFIPPT